MEDMVIDYGREHHWRIILKEDGGEIDDDT